MAKKLIGKSVNPKCYLCGVSISQKDNTLTIDHKYSRNDIRSLIVDEKKNVFLCCYKCNDAKNREEQIQMSFGYSGVAMPRLINMI